MQQELTPLDVTDLPALEQAAEEVKATGKPRRIVRGDEELAVLQPARKRRRPRLRGRPITADDPFWNLIGIGHSGLGDLSTNKQKYLVEAIADLHE